MADTAYYEEADSTETLDLYELLLENGVSVDFWFPKGRLPTPMDLHVVFADIPEHAMNSGD
jgi:hypothetical protein